MLAIAVKITRNYPTRLQVSIKMRSPSFVDKHFDLAGCSMNWQAFDHLTLGQIVSLNLQHQWQALNACHQYYIDNIKRQIENHLDSLTRAEIGGKAVESNRYFSALAWLPEKRNCIRTSDLCLARLLGEV